MKKRELKDIKHGERVFAAVNVAGSTFQEIQSKTFLDRNATQKALADLQKYGYIAKNEKALWIAVPALLDRELTQ